MTQNSNRFYRRFLIILIPILYVIDARSQNLIVNGSFEDENICAEFEQRCSPAGWLTTSLSMPFLGTTYSLQGKPADGNHFIELFASAAGLDNFRTFLSTKLLCSLKEGKSYTISFYARSTSNMLDSIGIYFTPYNFIFEKQQLAEIEPSIWIRLGKSATADITTSWIRKEVTFTATGAEVYFAIGVFKKTDIPGNKDDFKQLLLLDNINLISSDPKEQLCPDSDSSKRILYLQTERHSRLVKK